MNYDKILDKIIEICDKNDITASEFGVIIINSVSMDKILFLFNIVQTLLPDLATMGNPKFSEFDYDKFNAIVKKGFPNKGEFMRKLSTVFDKPAMENMLYLLRRKYGNIFDVEDLEII